MQTAFFDLLLAAPAYLSILPIVTAYTVLRFLLHDPYEPDANFVRYFQSVNHVV